MQVVVALGPEALVQHPGVAFPTLSSDVYGSIDFAPLTPSSSPQLDLELGETDWQRLG